MNAYGIRYNLCNSTIALSARQLPCIGSKGALELPQADLSRLLTKELNYVIEN